MHPRTGVCREEYKNLIAYVVWRLGFEMHVPILGPWDALLQVSGTRGGMKIGVAGQDERREFKGHQFLGFCAGDGVAIEQRVA
jgi:hypothetical protein